MDYERKQIIINALIQLLQSSPDMRQLKNTSNYVEYQNFDISKQEFDIWMNYVNSVIDVTYQYTALYAVLLTKKNIMSLSVQNELPYMQRIKKINDEIIGLTQEILQNY